MAESNKSEPKPKSPPPDTTDRRKRFGDGTIVMDHDTIRKHRKSK